MKRTIAALGATVIGLTGVVVGSAPAHAATPGCATSDDHVVSTGDPAAQDFYMSCTPLYGVGKAELTATSETAFSSDFTLADDTYATVKTTVDDAAASTYEDETVRGGFTSLSDPSTAGDSLSQSYTGNIAFPIASVAKIASSSLPAACFPASETYAGAYKVTYKPVKTAFYPTATSGQTIGGGAGVFAYSVAPAPVYLGLNFTAGGGSFDSNGAQCASTDNATYQADSSSSSSFNWDSATVQATSLSPSAFLNSTDLGSAALQASVAWPAITATTLPAGTVGAAYSAAVTATGDALSFSVDGPLPAGLSLNASTGVISGTPTATGHSSFTVVASNSVGSASHVLAIDIAAAPVPAAVATSVVLSATSSTYGKTASVAISVAAAAVPVTAALTATVDGVATPVPVLVGGKSALTLSKTLKPGKHIVAVAYAGNSSTTAQSSAVQVTVSKAVTSTTVKLAHKKSSAKVKASITVKVPGTSLTATGKAKIAVDGKTVKTVTLKKGKATTTFSVKANKKHKVVVTYVGSSLFASDKSVTYKVKK